MRRGAGALAAFAIGWMAGCNFAPVGPNYIRPDIPAPPAFREVPPPAEGWKAGQPRDDAQRGNWWEIYGDPLLNSLEEQVAINNQNVRAAAANYRAAVQAVQVARAGLYPVVSGGGAVTGAQQSANRFGGTFVVSNPLYDIQLPISATWEPDVWGQIRKTIEQNVANAQATVADLENALLSLRSQLAILYFEVQGLDAQQQILASAVAAYEQALQLTTNRFNQGVASQVDVAQAQTQLETARAQQTETQVLRAQYEHAIAVLIGKAPAEFRLERHPLTLQPPPTPAGLPSELLERRPDIAAAERRVAAANAQIGIAETAFYPTVTLAATFGIESSNIAKLFTWPSRFWSVGPTLAQTLWEAGRRRAVTEEAQAAYDANAAAYRQTVLTAFQQVEDDLSTLRLLDIESGEQGRAVEAAQRSLNLANIRYTGGITTYLEVITAQNALLSSQQIAEQLLTRRMVASVSLVRDIGGGWNAALDLPAAEAIQAVR